MFVGGIPERPMPLDPLRYMETWSFDGLINEYKDECEVIQNGNIISMPGLGGGENGIRIGNGVYEAFYTSGGASHTIHSMKDRGIKNCAYKTLRYAGHRQLVDYLMNYVKLTDDELKRVFDGSKNFYRDVKDKVVMLATVSSTKNSAVSFRKEIVINADDQFSAMQKATAFPISCIASIMAEGLLDPEARKVQKRDHYEVPDAPLTYRDVPYKLFEERLKTLM
jgi:saccharopine dehydrogenase-like NADP-dependent oxidoreductase